jgi:hypothetical protein
MSGNPEIIRGGDDESLSTLYETAFSGLTGLCVLVCAAYDTRMNHRRHPAFGWRALLVVASHPLRLILASLDAIRDLAYGVRVPGRFFS